MLTKFRAAGMVWPTVFALAALVVLIGLGNWQMSRKAWKDALVAQIEAGLEATPLDIGPGLHWGWGPPPQEAEYKRVRLAGRFLHSQERHLYALGREGPGWHIVTPLMLDGGMVALVNRGFVPDALKSASLRLAGQVSGRVQVTGLLRLPERQAMFTPANDPGRNIWFWRDVATMLRCDPAGAAVADQADCTVLAGIGSGGAGKPLMGAYPFVIDAEAAPANPGGWPRGGATNLQISNRHLEYALTWFGLAAALVAMYGAFAMSKLNPRRGSA